MRLHEIRSGLPPLEIGALAQEHAVKCGVGENDLPLEIGHHRKK